MKFRSSLLMLFIPLAAFIVVWPLLRDGCSCGHDFNFHLLNWIDVARSWHEGLLLPRWMHYSAWLAGEPRFVFYPPLSWLTGGALAWLDSLLPAPIAAADFYFVPIAYSFLVLTAAGFAAYSLARTRVHRVPAIICAAVYIANPYMLFVVYERTAYAELLAAIWFPLLLRALLAEEISIPGIAVPLALLWMSNAPAAVMGCYTLAIIALIRAIFLWREKKSITQFTLRITASLTLGLALAAFYIIPAAFERRWVQISAVVGGSLSPLNNFLFEHTTDAIHDVILATASWVAIASLFLTAIFFLAAFLRRRKNTPPHDTKLQTAAILAVILLLLLTPLTAPLWKFLPQLKFLQFPWRFTVVIATITVVAMSAAIPATLRRRWLIAAIAVPLIAVPVAYHCFVQYCDDDDIAAIELRGGGLPAEPTDEYTPVNADPDQLHLLQQPYFLAHKNDDPPSPTSTSITMNHDALENRSLTADLTTPAILVLRIWDFPAWHVTVNNREIAARPRRDDGLMAIPLPAGISAIHIWYAETPDRVLGNAVSLAAFAVLMVSYRRRRLSSKS